ncbi:MAG: DUF898 family protein [Bacilli bacterium]
MTTSNSEFTGGLLGLIGVTILTYLLIIVTLGIATPFAIAYRESWYASHTYIEGKRLMFVGTGVGLFVQWIKWLLLCIITFGIYSFWVGIKMKQWVVRNTVFA